MTEVTRTRGRWLGVSAPLVILVIGFLAGPRPRVDPSVRPPPLPATPAEIGPHLATMESRFEDIVPGTEKRVIWADPGTSSRTEWSVVSVHGFSATHRETAPLTEQLARALDANAFLTRLTGHGRTGEALGEATANDWLADAAEAVEIGALIGRRIVILGVSTGGTLATWVAAQPEYRDVVSALVLISPNYALRDSRAWILTMPWGAQIARFLEGPEYSFEPQNERHARYWTERYPVKALTEMAALHSLIDQELVGVITAPTLVFLSPNDRIIDPAAARTAFGWLGSPKQMIHVAEVGDGSNHVLAGDILSPGTTASVLARTLIFVESRAR